MIKVIHDNCLNGLKNVADKSVRCVLTDLPFKTTKNKWDCRIDLDSLWTEFGRVCANHCPVILFAVQPFTTTLINSNPKGYRHKWVWNKRQAGNFAVSRYMPMTITEDILVFSCRGERVTYTPLMTTGKPRIKGGRNSTKHGRGFGNIAQIDPYISDQYFPKDLLEFPGVPRTHRIHAAEKPVDLLKYLINTYTNEGDTVLDCTAGSFSTAIACIETNRQFVGFELDADIYSAGSTRVKDFLGKDKECEAEFF